ncbi:hypothetical protein N7519_009195 [Penicillium mononematosum]|uniref:uncharacterized protein n=1 Tax=Penicillium mononematosum TaxID=268346 RepID=UPI0025489602|nr:uncharacterized protein N7519_009195 [Penicillium mononematosum]KAJ6178734.1 hypothetical protein N7519_009195 [Penicillium mononematosum]
MVTHVLFAILVALPVVRAGGWDDFSNNLATDLAPFLSLFGEQITKQYLSESVRPIDYFIFAMAPMGILTGVVSTIRVCGTPSLRAFIGRAQEGAGNAEAELCTSTSRDVCELYNSGGIARVFGRPKILEVVHDPDHDFSDANDHTAGIYTFQEFIKREKGKELWKKEEPGNGMALWPWKGRKKDTESAESNTPFTTYAPNLSLNIGIKKQPKQVFVAIAIVGLILQVGVLVFAGVATYYLEWGNNDNPPRVLCMSASESTKEEVWCRQEDSKDRSSIYWIQPGGQIIGDQTFDPFSHTDCDNKLKKYMASKRNNGLQQPKLQVWVAVGITLSGFILQFTGLRGIHSAVSVAQLGVIMLMSIARAALRMKRLKSGDNCFATFPDEVLGHELDWLALRLGRDAIEKEIKRQPDSSSPGSLSFSTSVKRSSTPASTNEARHFWRFSGAPNTNKMSLKRPSPNYTQNAAAIVLAYRTRLASLTDSSTPSTAPARNFKDEMVEVRNLSRRLAALIEAAMKTIASKAELKGEVRAAWKPKAQRETTESPPMFWGINCTIGERGNDTIKMHTVYLKFIQDHEAPGSPWILQNKFELEGILGLWVWSLKFDPTEIRDSEPGFRKSMAIDVQPRRIVPTDKSIRTDLEMWLGDDMNIITHREYAREAKFADPGDASTIWIRAGQQDTATSSKSPSPSTTQPIPRKVRFFGRSAIPRSQSQYPQISSFSSAAIQGSLVSACAQEVFASFFASILEIVDDIGPVDIQEAETLRLENGLVAEIVRLFTEMRLGSRQEALLCVIPSVIPHLNVPSASKVLAAAKKIANQKRKDKEWERAETVLRWAWRICMNSQHSCTTATETNGEHELAKDATVSLCELYRWALLNETTRSFGQNGLSLLEKQKANRSVSACKSTCEVIDRYIAVKNEVPLREFTDADLLAAMEEANLLTALVILTHPPSKMENKTKGQALCVAAMFGWAEVVLALLELNGEPDFQDEDRRTPLSYAAQNGRVGVVKELSDWGIFPNSEDNYHLTPLLYASEAGFDEVVALLLRDIRVLPDQRDRWQRTPLLHAAEGGHEAVVNRLLETGKVDPDTEDNDRRTPLSYAAAGGHEAVVKRLFDTGKVDLDTKDRDGRTPLSHGAARGHEAIINRLLETGKVDPDAEDNDRRTPLSHAAAGGHEAIVTRLLDAGADLGTKDRDGRTPLSHGAARGHEAVVNRLLDARADPDAEDNDRRTPLSHAAAGGHEAIVTRLLDAGADPGTKDRYGRTPLTHTAARGHEAVVKRLLDAGADPNAKDGDERMPLSHAAGRGHGAVVTRLLDAGADLGTKDRDGRTPLSHGAARGHEAIIKRLLDAGANPDAESRYRWTPLTYAAARGHEAVVKRLLDAGADPDTKDRDGRTPLSYAAGGGHEAVIQRLLDTGNVDPDAVGGLRQTLLPQAAAAGYEDEIEGLIRLGRINRDEVGGFRRTPLSHAAEGGHEAIVKRLLDTGKVDPNAKDGDRRTPLTYAAAHGHEAVVKRLLDTGKVDPNAEDGDRWTPLTYAAVRGNQVIAKRLLDTGKVDPDARDMSGRTLLSEVTIRRNKSIMDLM